MTANISATSTDRAAAASPPAPLLLVPFLAPGRLWLRGAFYLAGAAQLITISALLSADPEPATWAMLLLAVAPVLLAAAAAFAPAPANVVCTRSWRSSNTGSGSSSSAGRDRA